MNERFLPPHRKYQLGEYALVSARWLLGMVSRGVRRLPLAQRYRLADSITSPLAWLWLTRSNVSAENFAVVLGAPRVTGYARQLARASIQNFGRMAMDFLAVCSMGDAEVLEWVTTVHAEYFYQAQQKRRGIILLLPHLGSWDVAAAYAQAIGCRLTVVTQTDWAAQVVAGARNARGITLAPRQGSLRVLFRTLARNDCVAILCDVAPSDLETVDVPFFGRLAAFPTGPARLAQRTGAPILVVSSVRLPGWRYQLTVQPPLLVEGAVNDAVYQATAAIANSFEQIIAARPEQWYPFHPVWHADIRERRGTEPAELARGNAGRASQE
jgi:lauroyl/myristoyl acyltransferase